LGHSAAAISQLPLSSGFSSALHQQASSESFKF